MRGILFFFFGTPLTRWSRRDDPRARGRSVRVFGKATSVGCGVARSTGTGRTGRRRRGRDRPFTGTHRLAAAACVAVEKGPRTDDRVGRHARTDAPREGRGRGESRCVDGRLPAVEAAHRCRPTDLKERFRAKTSTLRAKPMAPKERKKGPYFTLFCEHALNL